MMANYIARQFGYHMTGGFEQGDVAMWDHFKPIETFGQRFEGWLLDVRGIGFNAIDMYTGIIHPNWATEEHLLQAREALRRQGMAAYSFGGWMGSNPEWFTGMCRLANALDIPVLGGATSMLAKDRNFVVDTLKQYGLRLGIENHPEKSVEELLAKIGDGGDGTIGATVDTGWFGTQDVDAAEALEQLAPHLFLVHLKDVRAVGTHETCRYGDGIVPLERCVRVLQEIGYSGTISVEHEPDYYDPTEEIRESLQMLKGWLGEHGNE
ncbi:MAG: sugar phosphate isomerase/epimerase [Chloroflexota bacterium]|nr:sugar phosphate isomerase/epimerase [Chloroflexota bacterium]